MHGDERKQSGTWLALIVALMASLSNGLEVTAAAEESFIGMVFQINGSWTMITKSQDVRELKQFDAIADGARIIPHSKDATISIILKDKTKIDRSGAENYEQEIAMPSPARWEDLLADALKRLTNTSQRLVPAIARGTLEPSREGVAILSGGSIDLGSIFPKLSPGSYKVRLRAINSAGERDREVKLYKLQWNPQNSAGLNADGIKGGVYSIALVGTNGAPVSRESWILICDGDGCGTKQRDFQSFADTVTLWSGGHDPAAVRGMLRSYLMSLAGMSTGRQVTAR